MIYIAGIMMVIVFFIENRLSFGKQYQIHYVCIILFSFLSFEICNTLLCLTLLYWFGRSLKSVKLSTLPYMVPLSVLAFVLLLTAIISVLVSTKIREDMIGSAVRSFIIMTFWPIMISMTVPDISRLRKVAYFYAVIRIIEVGIAGMIIYFFYYKEFILFGSTASVYLDFPNIVNPRLISIGAPNSNDAAFVLLGGMGFVVYRLFNNFKFLDLALSIIAFFGMIFTWTRSVWIFLLLYFIIIIGLRKVNLFAVLFLGIVALILGSFAVQLFEERRLGDNRLQSNENAVYRQQQMIDYLVAIPDMNLFWGVFDDTQTVKSKLHIRGEFSSENYTLETFTKHGIVAGSLFVVIFTYFIFNFWRTTRAYVRVHQRNRDDIVFVVAVFAVYIALFFMTQSSLFRNNLILWVMVGFMSVIKKQSYNGSR